MDAVYLCRPGPNEELRYSLRSLSAHVSHDRVWVVGDAPSWLSGAATLVRSPRKPTKYLTTTAHLIRAVNDDRISDPFVMWNDDFYAVRPIGVVPRMHRGDLRRVVQSYGSLRSKWATGMNQTYRLLDRMGIEPLYSYELHVPLVVRKADMSRALEIARRSCIAVPHKRTIYGNIAQLGGRLVRNDPKISDPRRPIPAGDWWSSSDGAFRDGLRSRLHRLFPDPSEYER